MAVLPFASPNLTLDIAGGKGANLARLSRAGFPVPPGFIIATDEYRTYVADNGLAAGIRAACFGVAAADVQTLDAASLMIRRLFAAGRMRPETADSIRRAYTALGEPPVAVRSSATAEDLPDLSFAGQQDTYLNIRGADPLLRAVVQCWSSLWTARAMGYRLRNAIDRSDLALAIVVQKMVESETSGVLFTANPLTGSRRESVIDATFGLGEALVSGQVEPDHYVVDTPGSGILSRKVGGKGLAIRSRSGGGTESIRSDEPQRMALSDEQILQVAALGWRVQKEFEAPQDIEWAFQGEALTLLQSRPITSLYPLPVESFDPLKVWFSFGSVQGLLGPMTPLGLDSVRLVIAGAGRLFGLDLPYERLEVLRVAGERLWVQVDGLIRNPLGARVVPGFFPMVEPSVGRILETLARDPHLEAGNGKLRLSTVARLARFGLSMLPRFIWTILQPERAIADTYAAFEDYTGQAGFSGSGDMVARLSEFVSFLRDRSVVRAFELIIPRFLPIMASSMGSLGLLTRLSGQAGAGDHGVAPLVLEVTRGVPDNVTTEMGLALWQTAKAIRTDPASLQLFQSASPADLARSYLEQGLPQPAQSAIEGFMARYGMRGIGEIDLGMPRWRERPEPIMQTLQSYLQITDEDLAPDVLFTRHTRLAVEAVDELAALARQQRGGWLKEKLVRSAARRVRVLMGIREAPKYYAIRVMGLARAELLSIGQDFAARGLIERPDDLFYLYISELDALSRKEPRDWKALIASHRLAFERESRRRQVPRVLVSDGRAFYEGLGPESASGDVMAGSPVSPGVAEGRVHVILDPHLARLAPGEILVCPGTDPAWTPLFMTAAGLITEVGGMMTHGAAVAREYGIPAVVGVDRATTRLKDGQKIRLDGTTGQIILLP